MQWNPTTSLANRGAWAWPSTIGFEPLIAAWKDRVPGDPARLPDTILQALPGALATRPRWQPPVSLQTPAQVLGVLGDSLSNYSVLVALADDRCVLRFDGIDPAQNGLDRAAEWTTLGHAAAAAIAPRPRHLDRSLGLLVTDFLPADTDDAPGLAAIADLLRSIHRLPAGATRLRLADRVRRYEQLLRATAPAYRPLVDRFSERMGDLCSGLDRCEPSVLCHNDLTPANLLLHGGRLLALDWEYAGRTSPYFDLAVLHCETLSCAPESLLAAYLERQPRARELRDFAVACCVYRYLALLWQACNATRKGGQPPAHAWATQGTALETALSALARDHG